MMNVILFPFRIALKACKAAALVLALIMVIGLLVPKMTAASQQACDSCSALQIRCAELQEECETLRQVLNSEYRLLRRIDLRFFGQEWLTLRTVEFWNSVGYSQYEAFPEGTSEQIWSSGILEMSFTTLERSCIPCGS